MNIKIKEYKSHFHIFSIYMKIDCQECQELMKIFFRNLPNSGTSKNSDKKVDTWWSGSHKPQNKQLEQVNIFFKNLATKIDKEWNDNWLCNVTDELESEKPLYGAVRKYEQPYCIARFHSDYVYENTKLMEQIVKAYCHKYFFIYRIHSSNGMLVRDVLKFHGHNEDKIFCNLFKYTNHDINSPKNLEWKNIEQYHGNVFFNSSCLNITLISNHNPEHGNEYAQLSFPRFYNHLYRIGLLSSLTDETHKPMAAGVFIQATKIKNIDSNEMNKYVGVIDNIDCIENDNITSKEIIENLKRYFMVIEQVEGLPLAMVYKNLHL